MARSALADLCRLFAVDQPRDPEFIDQHAKSKRPEGLLQRHLHRPLFCQSLEYALGLCRLIDADRHSEALDLLLVIRRAVSALQYLAAHNERGMEDLVVPFGWNLVGHRRIAVGEH